MIKKTPILFLALFCCLFISCGAPSIGIIMLPFQIVDHKTYYYSNNQDFKNKNITIENSLDCSPNAEFKYSFPNIINEIYTYPYSYNILIRFPQNSALEYFQIKSVQYIKDDEEIGLLEILKTSTDIELNVWSGTSSRDEEEKLASKILNKEKVIIESDFYGISFHNLPINIDKDKTVIIKYNIMVTDKNGKTSNINQLILYSKKYEKIKMYHPIFNPKSE